MNYIKRTDTMDIYVEPNRNAILIRQRWKYNWLTQGNVAPWTYLEKRNWHHKADSIIWEQWGNKFVFLAVTLEPNPAIQYLHRMEFNVAFDIEWVTSDEHWTVDVTKVKPGTNYKSHTIYKDRTISLTTEDTKSQVVDPNFSSIHQIVINHEYGHSIGADDEYGVKYMGRTNGPYYEDLRALMNIGNELRLRYVQTIKKELNTNFIPGVQFTALFK